MDDELFQILSLFLLLGLLLTLFGVLQSLGAIRKALEKDEPRAAPSPVAAASPVAQTSAPAETATSDPDQSPLTWARPTEAETSASERSGWPSPQEAAVAPAARVEPEPEPEPTPQPAEETSAASEANARVLYGDAGLTTATPDEAALRTSGGDEPESNPFETIPEPRQKEPEPQAAAAEDPQEQPFERDGRWWFRRGDELLVYEEQTGQWVAAGEPSKSGSVAATAGGGTGSPAAETSGGSAAGQVTRQLEPAGSFWKCPSCGAVNGSTATSCRMCFTARP